MTTTSTDTKTTTVKTTTDVEIPTVDDRKLETYWLVQNVVGEVLAIHDVRKDAECALRELAKGKTGEENPRLFMVQSFAVPTDQKLAKQKAS
jgi:hypothetical protein